MTIDQTAARFEEHRPLLFGIAYRMLGSVTDAQDMVQDTYLRWQQAAADSIKSHRAWLTTVVTRLSINHLQSARVQREAYVGPWLPEPLVDEQAEDPANSAQLAESLSLAFLVLLETLNPIERAVFILREGFDCEFSEIGRIVEKSEANCRQILTRARKRVHERRPRFDLAKDDAEKLVAPFAEAMRRGDLQAMLARLAKNVVLVSDAGGRPGALLKPLHGAEPVARAMLHAARKHGADQGSIQRATVNGLPGFVRFEEGRALAVLAFGTAEGLIQSVFVISNPDKLRHLSPPPAKP